MDPKRPPQPLKLKDSCDMCSASKVKCNKEKPTCSRCKKLGYPCFYSPARRLGRPHPSNKAAAQNKARASITSTEAASPRESKHEDEDSDSSFCPREPESTREKPTTQTPAAPKHTFIEQPKTYTFQPPFPPPKSPMVYRGPARVRKESSRIPESTKDPRPNTHRSRASFQSNTSHDHSPFEDYKFDFSRSTPERSIKQSQTLSPRTLSTSLPSQTHQEQPRHPSVRTNSTFSNTSDTHFYLQPPFLEPGSTTHTTSDCLTTAMEILHKLNTITHQRQNSPNPLTPTTPTPSPTLHRLLLTISQTTPFLIPILTCPCSQNPEVGLLIAAVCSSLLQIYGIILRDSKIQCDEKGNGVCVDGNFNGSDREEEVTIIKVLGELPRVASLIMGFERRYVGGGGGEVLATLGKGLRGTLRGMSREATNWLADV